MNVNYVILIENRCVLHDCWKGDVIRRDQECYEKVVEVTRNDCVNLHRTSTLLDLISQDQNNPLTHE
jgi:hypothetical protein